MASRPNEPQTLFGHPVGLYTLFFAEMWERFSYYGMRALLIFYMIKGFLGYSDDKAYRVYGAYTALVYMTPFFGGLIADRILGSRRSVILGGLLMAAGPLAMTVRDSTYFYLGLALLIVGNGFFKPNISTLVGSLYPADSPKRDGGFTIFYIGINLGAAMSPLLCGYIGENFGWHRGFGLATIGMLTGLAVFVAPNLISQFLLFVSCFVTAFGLFSPAAADDDVANLVKLVVCGLLVLAGITSFVGLAWRKETALESESETWLPRMATMLLVGGGAIFAAFGMLRLYGLMEGSATETLFMKLRHQIKDGVGFMELFTTVIDLFVTACLLAAAVVASLALMRGGLPTHAGAPRHPERLRQKLGGFLPMEIAVYLGALASIPVFMLFVSNFEMIRAISAAPVPPATPEGVFQQIAAVFRQEFGSPAGMLLFVACIGAFAYLILQLFRLQKVARERMAVALILTFFSLLFWALFEQAGSSLNNFADRNIDRVSETRRITKEEVGTTVELQPTQEQLGYPYGGKKFTLTDLTEMRDKADRTDFTVAWPITEAHIGMGIADRNKEVAASTYQAINPVYILILGLVFSALWSFLGSRGLEPSTPFKFAMGLLQLGLGYAAFWYGAQSHDPRGMVLVGWLFLGYLLHTMGELCLSPVGLSMITKLSPAFLVSTMMGTWFLATAMSQFLAGIIAQFTKVDSEGAIPLPLESVGKYGGVFGILAVFGIASSAICFALVPLLKAWMHEGEAIPDEDAPSSRQA